MYNSDGYVMIDMKDVNMSQSSQHISGIYNRVVSVIDTNKLALIINAGSNTPMAAVVHKRLNYYVINTTLFIFTINSNDIVIIEEAGTATVDVEIVPTLTEGVKVADFAVGAVEGSIYAPAQQSEINDNVTASNTTWSSDKISDELSDKADSSSLATVATTGAYSDLSGTPTIPVLTDLIDDSVTAVNKVWSSDKTAAEIAAGAGVTIDDTTTSLTKTWSSRKIDSELSDKADTATTYTKTEVNTALSGMSHNIAEEYNPATTYSLGDLVVHDDQFYKSIANNVTGAWDSTKWNEVTVASELTNIVVKRTLTETTTGNGNVVNYIDVANGIIVSAICTSQEALVIPFMNSLGTMYSFHVMSQLSAHGVVANTQVTIDFYMIPNRRIINN